MGKIHIPYSGMMIYSVSQLTYTQLTYTLSSSYILLLLINTNPSVSTPWNLQFPLSGDFFTCFGFSLKIWMRNVPPLPWELGPQLGDPVIESCLDHEGSDLPNESTQCWFLVWWHYLEVMRVFGGGAQLKISDTKTMFLGAIFFLTPLCSEAFIIWTSLHCLCSPQRVIILPQAHSNAASDPDLKSLKFWAKINLPSLKAAGVRRFVIIMEDWLTYYLVIRFCYTSRIQSLPRSLWMAASIASFGW